MTFTPIDELPPPPAWMVEDAEKTDLAEAHSLLPQLWTIREFRKIALPIVLGVKSNTGPIMREAIKTAKDATTAHWMSYFPREERLAELIAEETFRRSINRTTLCDAKRNAAKAFQEKQLEKFVAFKSGRVPKNRLNAARNMISIWRDGMSFHTRNRNTGDGKLFVKMRFHTRWEMIDYWKKNYKYANPYEKIPVAELKDIVYDVRCVIY